MLARRIAVFGLAMGVLAACQKREPLGPDEPARDAGTRHVSSPAPVASHAAVPAPLTRPERPLNVLLLTLDSFRADMPWAGYPRPIAPNLSRLAEESVVWENHRSVVSYTAQSVATLLSGRYASTLYRNGLFFTSFAASNRFFPEVLQERGTLTMGLHAHMYFERGKGLDQGFDVWETVPGITFDAQTDNDVTSDKSARRLIELLGKHEVRAKPFFVWAHFMDPHDKYIPHRESPDFGKNNRDRYDSEVFFTDLWLGKVLDFARQQPWWGQTAVIVTGDHGEAFGEHGMYKHAFELWDVLLRVPLIMHVPGAVPRRISAARTHIDLAPTILDLMGQSPVPPFQGQSLVPELFGATAEPRHPLLFELSEDSNNPGLRAIIDGNYKLIVPGDGSARRLFDLERDPGELHNLSGAEAAKQVEMSALLAAAFARVPSIPPFGGTKLRSGRRATGPEGPSQDN